MKTKTTLFLILFLFTLSIFSQTRYLIDSDKSEFIWIGKKLTGEHKGKVKITKGEFSIDKNNILTIGKFEIDMTSITNDDLTDAAYKTKFEGHLKSADFFDVDKYPTAKFSIKGPVKIEKGNIKIKGDLTIKDVTKTIEFKAVFVSSEDGYKIFANFSVDRSQFNVKYGSATFFSDIADKVIYDDFQVLLNLSLKKSDATEKK